MADGSAETKPGLRGLLMGIAVALAGLLALYFGFSTVPIPDRVTETPEAATTGSAAADATAVEGQATEDAASESAAPEGAETDSAATDSAAATEPDDATSGAGADALAGSDAGADTATLPLESAAGAEPAADAAADTGTATDGTGTDETGTGEDAASATAPGAGAEEAATAEAGSEAAAATEAPAATAASPSLPAFDTVRVTLDGAAIVAGRALPRAAVAVLVDGAEVSRALANATGNFAALFDVTPSPDPRLITLRMENADGTVTESAESVILAPVMPRLAEVELAPDTASDQAGAEPGTQPVAEPEVAADSAADAGPETEIVADTGTGTQPVAPDDSQADIEATAAGAAEAEAPTVIIAGSAGARVISPDGAEPSDGVSIDAIATNPAGGMAVSGRATGGAFVRVYADNAEISTVDVDDAGDWKAPLPEGAPPRYTLRVDHLDDAGTVIARIETEVTRETRDELAGLIVEEVRANGATGAVVVTVQRGFTLWAIARDNYGDGRLYVKVFEANRHQIRDPDLIYPGQVFTVPLPASDGG